ncbi:Purine ribonucleoside efflux pump nepI [Achromobacter sp. 2789STDY5608615]|uniref:MFS transporter n=1 Tax=Achromobacter sp. 2789STDY5608615 TaxID=1806492 RepID=UPI0006BF161E|nr:MFS transporter [Achromobacter sp. 2789STDY5608615]CUK00382.1 Purine ribonucleoside efflux pump nepI [Achromobacter sp. 2789STDY5608615]
MTRGISLNPAAARGESSRGAWAGVLAAGMATFCVVTTEMLPVGLLVPIAASLDVSVGRVGWLMVAPGLLAALCAPLVVVGARGIDRRRILCGLLLLLALANLGSALAPGLAGFLAARVLIGLCIGGIWAVAGGLADRLVPAASVGMATAVIFGGVAVASVLGVPLGALIGNLAGWRSAFGAMAALSAAALLFAALALPPLPVAQSVTARQLSDQLRNPGLRRGLFITLFLVAGHFMAYTFVRPVLQTMAGGAAARRPRATLLVITLGLLATLALLPWLGDLRAAAAALLLLWGLLCGGVSVALQTWVMQAARGAVEAATSLFVGVFNLAIALGALAGGVSVDHWGLPATLLAAAACMLAALAVLAGRYGR